MPISKKLEEINKKLIGTKIGKLSVIEQIEPYVWRGTVKTQFRCLCECGYEHITYGTKLRNNKVYQCMHCAYKERPQSSQKHTDEERLFNLTIVSRCKKTAIGYTISVDDYIRLTSNNCFYCGASPINKQYSNNAVIKNKPIYLNGLDRVNPLLGYDIDNCVACCKQCNFAKSNQTIDEFKNYIKRIYTKWIEEKDITKEN